MSDEQSAKEEIDFAGKMQDLAQQAGEKRRPSPGASPRIDPNDVILAVGPLIRPLANDIEVVKKAAADNNLLLTAIGKALGAQQAAPQSLEIMAQQMQRMGSVESANQKLFDALYGELKGYKDNFLFDALQRPMVRDLVTLFDDLTALHTQILKRREALNNSTNAESVEEHSEHLFLQSLAGNLENQLHHIIEVFLRANVEITQSACGSPVDKKFHRTVGFEAATDPDEDGRIARSVKPGFYWRDRPVRPEDVIVRRWQAPKASSAKAAPAPEAEVPAADDTPA